MDLFMTVYPVVERLLLAGGIIAVLAFPVVLLWDTWNAIAKRRVQHARLQQHRHAAPLFRVP